MSGQLMHVRGNGWSKFLLLVMFCALARPVVAQLPTATLLGSVKDSSGAVVPGANVSARATETGQTRVVTSGADGAFRLSALPVGNYEIRVEHPGFRTQVQSGLSLTVGQEAVLNFTMEVGAIEQTVEVTAEAPLVNTTSGTLGGLVDEKRIAELPLNGRNFVDLTFLQAGVQRDPASKAGGPIMRGDWFSGNGAPGRSNNFLLDGTPMTNLNGNSPATNADWSPGVEGIREFRVVTNGFSAEYGMKMGSQVTIASKSGGNAMHGSLFEYFRNSALDARNFFDKKTPTTPRRLPAFTRNNFGGSLGGPVIKDKLFYFGVYETLRERLGTTQNADVPTLEQRAAFTSPVTRPFLRFYPLPNVTVNGILNRFNYSPTQPTTGNYGQMRTDYTLSNSDNMFVRYTIQDSELTQPTNIPEFGSIRTGRAQFLTLSETHIFSPKLLNTLRISYSRTKDGGINTFEPAGPDISFVPGLGMGQLVVGGLTSIGPASTNPLSAKQNIFAYADDAIYTLGAHSMKFGTLINRYQQYSLTSTQARGQINFAGIPQFQAGGPLVSYTAVTPGSTLDRSWEFSTFGFYLQDDYRVNSNFTLNLGLRYEFHTDFNETRGKGSALRDRIHDAQFTVGPLFRNPSKKNFSPRLGFAWDATGDGKTAVRGGFALLYDVAIGIGGAIITTTALPPFATTSAINNPATLVLPLTFTGTTVGKTTRPMEWNVSNPHLLQYNFTVERQLPSNMALTAAYAGTRGKHLVFRYEGNPTTPQILPDGRKFWRAGLGRADRANPNWDSMELKDTAGSSWYDSLQLTFQKKATKGLQLQATYTWSKALDMTQSQITEAGAGGDAPPPDPLNLRLEKAPMRSDVAHNMRLSTIYRLPELASKNAMVGKLVNGWQVSGLFSLQSGYAFNPSITANRSRSIAGVGTFGGNSDRPDIAPGRNNENITKGKSTGCTTSDRNQPIAAGTPLGSPDLYFDICAFTLQPEGFLGTVGRNVLRGPGLANMDLSLSKDTAMGWLGETGRLEFRAEFFNILNRVNLDARPNSTLFAGGATDPGAPLVTAGRINATVTTSRQIQLALKLLF